MNRNTRARLLSGNLSERILCAVHPRIVYGDDESAGLQSRLLRGAADLQVGNEHAASSESVLRRLLVGDILRNASDPAADDAPVGNDVTQYAAHHVDGNGKADSLHAEVLGHD